MTLQFRIGRAFRDEFSRVLQRGLGRLGVCHDLDEDRGWFSSTFTLRVEGPNEAEILLAVSDWFDAVPASPNMPMPEFAPVKVQAAHPRA